MTYKVSMSVVAAWVVMCRDSFQAYCRVERLRLRSGVGCGLERIWYESFG